MNGRHVLPMSGITLGIALLTAGCVEDAASVPMFGGSGDDDGSRGEGSSSEGGAPSDPSVSTTGSMDGVTTGSVATTTGMTSTTDALTTTAGVTAGTTTGTTTGSTTTSTTGEGSTTAAVPVDCSPLVASGWSLCSEDADTCGVVFDDGTGCSAVCEAAGLSCLEVWENLEDACGPDTARAALSCDEDLGHQSDYCLCGAGEGTTGTSSGTTGTGSTTGTDDTTTTDGTTTTSTTTGTETGDDCMTPPPASPLVGWAAVAGNGVSTTTGGGDATPTVVTSLDELRSAASGDTPRVIHVLGQLEPGDIDIGSNKTIIGLCGAEIHGHVEIREVENVIIRNIAIIGYARGDCSLDPDYDSSEGCSSGNDTVAVQRNAHHIWFDHCEISDGADGNLDITNAADYITVSWTRFRYEYRTDNEGDDSTGGAGHRYSNLVGGTDSPSSFDDANALNITWHHNWWADNVVERQPRVRFGRNHLFNNLYTSDATNYCIRAGIDANILIENNVFDGVDDPHEFNNSSNQQTAHITAQGNDYISTSGDMATGGGGVPFTNPPYAYTLDPVSQVRGDVEALAGPQ